jgi:lyso-ornithine lipid O-acyltransferase
MARLRIGLMVVVLLLLTALTMPLQAVAIRFGWPVARFLPWLWHRVACPLAGLRVIVNGRPADQRPLMLVANHQSWADILALGHVMPLSFIAKSEVREWPGFGMLARLQRTIFVARDDRTRTAEQADAIADRLTAGDAMVLFAEGTTSDGNAVLPFKTALFGAAQAALRRSDASAVAIQPVSIAYVRAHGLPLGRFFRPLAAWPGDVTLAPHLLRFLSEGAIDVEISFAEPIVFTGDSDRKAVARKAEAEVRRMMAASLAGHTLAPDRRLAAPTAHSALASDPT